MICARGKEAYRHRGNRSFRATLEHHLPTYAAANSKQKKSAIVSSILSSIQAETPDGGFIRRNDKGQWCRVSVGIAREKIGQGYVAFHHQLTWKNLTLVMLHTCILQIFPVIFLFCVFTDFVTYFLLGINRRQRRKSGGGENDCIHLPRQRTSLLYRHPR